MLENMRLAWEALRANKMRSFLTMLGMIIGIGSVIAIVSIGDTMRAVVADQYASVGVNRAVAYVNSMDGYYRDSDNYTIDEIEKIKEVFADDITYMVPNGGATAEMTNQRNKMDVNLEIVDAGYAQVQPVEILYGRMINENDVQSKQKHVVLEEKTAQKLFGVTDATGRTIRATVDDETDDYLVVGVYREQVSALMALASGMMESEQGNAYVPYTTLYSPDDQFFALDFFLKDGINQEEFRSEFVTYEAKVKNRTKEEIVYSTASEEMGMVDSMMSALSAAVGAIAAISLVVGGIGIMNIMMVSVTERTREIGIRKALGARTKDILTQFLTESAMISAAGGIIGILLGVGIVALGGMLINIDTVIQPGVVLIAVVFSAVVGIFFGLYPAMKAAKADPIIALRYE